MKKQFVVFVLRWVLNTFGLWVAVYLFGTGYDVVTLETSVWIYLLAGLIFSVMNSVIRPIIIILSLPAIMVTLGLFTVLVNGLMVYWSLLISPGLNMTFWHSVLTGLVLSLINYIVSGVLERRAER